MYPKNRIDAAVYFAGQGEKVLDIGCGDGRLLYQLSGNFNELFGFEIDSERVEISRKKLKDNNAKIYQNNIEEKSDFKNGFFDVIISTDVIEHVPDVFKAFKEISRLIKPGGKLVMITPNIAEIRRRFTLLFGKFPSTSARKEGLDLQGGSTLFDGGHLHYFTFSVLKKLFKMYGFDEIKTYGFGKFGRLHNLRPQLFSPEIVITGIRSKD